MVDQVRDLLKPARTFVEAGDGNNALVLLEAITDEYVKSWYYLDDSDGFAGDFFSELGELWTEACLVCDLTPEERKGWARKLTRWQSEIEDYGIEEVFDPAQVAVLRGWDHAPLQRILRGEDRAVDEPDDKVEWYAYDLNTAVLSILERQGRHDEYLRLSAAEGRWQLHAGMLARLGRVQEAVDDAARHFGDPQQCLSLAGELHERGELEAALHVARHGLTLDGNRGALAVWLRDLAEGMGESECALDAAQVALKAMPSLDAYERVQKLAGERWADLREELLAHLRQAPGHFSDGGKVDIFLASGLLDDAIATVHKNADYDMIQRVMDAAIEHRPDWVIGAACRQAERIAEAGQSKYYHHVVGWLERARAAYRATGREADWEAYVAGIRAQHSRKRRLMEEMRRFI